MQRGIAATGLLLTAMMLFGCVEKPQEGGTLPPLASSSASSSASPSLKRVGTDVAQITALAKDYFAECNRAINTGDTKRFRTLWVPTCKSCVALAEYIEKKWNTGSLRAPGYWQVHQVSGATVSTPIYGYANIVYTTGQETQLDASGRTIKVNPPTVERKAISVYFVKSDGEWKITDVEKV